MVRVIRIGKRLAPATRRSAHWTGRRRKVVDRYTKGALTAIALSLSIIAVQNAVGTSAAQQTPMKVQICDDLLRCVQLTPVAHDRYALPTVATPEAPLLQSECPTTSPPHPDHPAVLADLDPKSTACRSA